MPQRKFKFTERDSSLLVDLYKHRFLIIEQIQRLHFPSKQTAYRRMRLLKAAGYVSAFTVANIGESIFMVSPQGMQAVAETLGVDRDQLKWVQTKAKPRDYYFMRHFLAINDFRITLRLACEASGIQMLGFIPDYYGEKTESGVAAKYIRDAICDIANEREEVSHTPDGVFALERNGKQALFFLEIDRGTEIVSDHDKGVLKSVRFYANYLLEGKYQRYAKDFGIPEFKGFRSLYVTTTDIRLANIRQAAGALPIPIKAKRFNWITTFDKLTPSTIFTPIWFSTDPTDDSMYQIG
jgi:hypothetical protein